MKVAIAMMLMLAPSASAAGRSDHGLASELVRERPAEVQAAHEFNTGLRSIGSTARVAHCTELRQAHPGKVQTIYGGRCALSNNTQVVMCADTAVGNFALSYDGDVSDFMDNCGG